MNKKQKQRKKWLKRRGLYISPRDTWNLDTTIAEFILPRLKLFKKLNNGYPGKEEMDTPEKWDEALDKMILAFQYLKDWEYWWFNDPKYDYFTVECSNDKSLMQKTKMRIVKKKIVGSR